jgi:hypothetical protein
VTYTRANPTSQQTNAALIPAIPGQQIKVKNIYVSSDTELTITLVNSESHTILWRQYVGARGGVVSPCSWMTATGEGVDITTSASGSVYLMVGWERTFYKE